MTNSSIDKRQRKAKARKFYIVSLDYRTRSAPGWRMENLARLEGGRRGLSPPVGQRGFVQYPEPPRLLIDKSLGRAPRDFEIYHGYWLVSDRMKSVLEKIDPEAVAFVKCETHYGDGRAGPVSWLCDVLRILDAVDEEKSRLKIQRDPQDRKWYSFLGGANLFFREEIVGSTHIFRLRYSSSTIICDESFKAACKEASLKGIGFSDAANY
jgi:hypothetical protein